MGIFSVLRTLLLIILLLGAVFMISRYAEPIKTAALGLVNIKDDSVLGASSERAQEITDKVGSDMIGHIAVLQKQILALTLGDVVNTLMRVQKIPQDLASVHAFVKEQADNVLQSVNKK